MSSARPHLGILAGLSAALGLGTAAAIFWGVSRGEQLALAAGLTLSPWLWSTAGSALAIRRRGHADADKPGVDGLRIWQLVGAVLSLAGAVAVFLWAPIAPVEGSALWPMVAGLGVGAVLSGVLAAFFSGTRGLPESQGLATWSRWGLWTLALSAGWALLRTQGWGWAETGLVNALAVLTGGLSLELAWGALRGIRPLKRPATQQLGWYPGSTLGSLRLVGSRLNPVGSAFDVLEQRSGIDLKGTWAIQVLRRSLEPLAAALLLLGWLSTSLTVVDLHESGVRERFGVAQPDVLEPGLHLSLPWPIDRVQRVPTGRVQTMKLGHGEAPAVSSATALAWLIDLGYTEPADAEEEEEESRLWAKSHAAEEYTLLLGDGRDLISVDGLLHYRIVDPHAWLYATQNPEQALESAAYRALMVHTADKDLDQALSENLQVLAGEIRQTIELSIAAQGLGVEIVDFTLEALHPPVLVATDYQSVVSAQIERQRLITEAQGYRLGRLPLARTEARVAISDAEGAAATRLAEARGEAAGFSAVNDAYRASPQGFKTRRRLEVIERKLAGRRLYILDSRFEGEGGNVWLME